MPRCMKCGGMVREDGYAEHLAEGGEVEPCEGGLLEEVDRGEPGPDFDGDEVRAPESRMGTNEEPGWELEQRQAVEGGETGQQSATELLRGNAFATAYRRRRMAMGGMVSEVVGDEAMGATKKPAKHDGERGRTAPDAPQPGEADYITPEREAAQAERDRETMRKKKAAKYGFGSR